MTLLIVLLGWVLTKNVQWFNGAHTVGVVLIVAGIIAFICEALVWIGFIAAAASHKDRF